MQRRLDKADHLARFMLFLQGGGLRDIILKHQCGRAERLHPAAGDIHQV